jgi:hypothetical protein
MLTKWQTPSGYSALLKVLIFQSISFNFHFTIATGLSQLGSRLREDDEGGLGANRQSAQVRSQHKPAIKISPTVIREEPKKR